MKNYHKPPSYYGYVIGTFSSATKCQQCHAVALERDCPPVEPCRYCGGRVVRIGAAKWVPPVYKGFLWWKKVVRKGYWGRPDVEVMK